MLGSVGVLVAVGVNALIVAAVLEQWPYRALAGIVVPVQRSDCCLLPGDSPAVPAARAR